MEYFLGVLMSWLIGIFLYSNFKSRKKNKDEEDVEPVLFDWDPEPLVPKTINSSNKKKKAPSIVVNTLVGKFVNVEGKELLNFASHNYLGLVENENIKERSKKAIYKYGVGSCGPRGFYGTVDVHLELESNLANFMKTESCIVYSYGFSTIASAIAAYVKKNDVIFADERVNFAIQRGMEASRSKIIYFKHNDMYDLEKCIKTFRSDLKKKMKKKSEPRKFLIVEGIYINTGKICALPELLKLKNEYKIRLFIDESVSFGVLGQSGRGVVDHFDADINDVDMIMASMEYALGTGGGFCVGSTFVIEPQRLAGQGYCFSASLPPFLAVAANAALDVIEKNNYEIISSLRERCSFLFNVLKANSLLQQHFIIEGDDISPIKHLILKPSPKLRTADEEWDILYDMTDYCREKGVMICVANYLIDKEHFVPPRSIRLTTSVTMDESNILLLVNALENSISKYLL